MHLGLAGLLLALQHTVSRRRPRVLHRVLQSLDLERTHGQVCVQPRNATVTLAARGVELPGQSVGPAFRLLAVSNRCQG